jgi:hypothetical protein
VGQVRNLQQGMQTASTGEGLLQGLKSRGRVSCLWSHETAAQSAAGSVVTNNKHGGKGGGMDTAGTEEAGGMPHLLHDVMGQF